MVWTPHQNFSSGGREALQVPSTVILGASSLFVELSTVLTFWMQLFDLVLYSTQTAA
jgi:hypothetical protein